MATPDPAAEARQSIDHFLPFKELSGPFFAQLQGNWSTFNCSSGENGSRVCDVILISILCAQITILIVKVKLGTLSFENVTENKVAIDY